MSFDGFYGYHLSVTLFRKPIFSYSSTSIEYLGTYRKFVIECQANNKIHFHSQIKVLDFVN